MPRLSFRGVGSTQRRNQHRRAVGFYDDEEDELEVVPGLKGHSVDNATYVSVADGLFKRVDIGSEDGSTGTKTKEAGGEGRTEQGASATERDAAPQSNDNGSYVTSLMRWLALDEEKPPESDKDVDSVRLYHGMEPYAEPTPVKTIKPPTAKPERPSSPVPAMRHASRPRPTLHQDQVGRAVSPPRRPVSPAPRLSSPARRGYEPQRPVSPPLRLRSDAETARAISRNPSKTSASGTSVMTQGSVNRSTRPPTVDLTSQRKNKSRVKRSPVVPVQSNRIRSSHRPFDHPSKPTSFNRRASIRAPTSVAKPSTNVMAQPSSTEPSSRLLAEASTKAVSIEALEAPLSPVKEVDDDEAKRRTLPVAMDVSHDADYGPQNAIEEIEKSERGDSSNILCFCQPESLDNQAEREDTVLAETTEGQVSDIINGDSSARPKQSFLVNFLNCPSLCLTDLDDREDHRDGVHRKEAEFSSVPVSSLLKKGGGGDSTTSSVSLGRTVTSTSTNTTDSSSDGNESRSSDDGTLSDSDDSTLPARGKKKTYKLTVTFEPPTWLYLFKHRMQATIGMMNDEGRDPSTDEERSMSTNVGIGDSMDTERTKHDDLKIRENLIMREERAVRTARVFVIATIIAMTIGVSVAVYFASVNDRYSFDVAYQGFVEDIKSLVQWEVQYNFALVNQLANTITSTSVERGTNYPYLTLDHFEIIGGFVDGMGGVMCAAYAPLVTDTERNDWEEYSVKNQGWIQQSWHLKQVELSHQDALHGTIQDHEHDRRVQENQNEKISPVLYKWENGTQEEVPVTSGQLHAPVWQVSPPDVATVNVDLLQDNLLRTLFDQVRGMNRSVLSPATPITDMFGFLFDPEEAALKPNPYAYILQPLFDSFEVNKTMVGLVVAVTSYENLLDKLLPDGTSGIVCVIRDSCGTNISYVLEGREATFLGYGDFHDQRFDRYMANVTIELYENVTDDVCVHTLEIYPTASLQAAYETNKPAVYTSVVALSFFVTTVLLIVYDRLVTRRQEKTMASAIRSGKLVASLFPSSVVDRVMQDAQDGEKNFKKKSSSSETSADSDDKEQRFFKTRPIADFFPQCTIIFADISGFTSWASTREPHQVFILLETLYGSLDRIAKGRGIFKVETVGDCYVAVSGLPTPCKDHAVVIGRFARDCMDTIQEVTRTLEVSLGPDTADLAFRIGLHSGCVTGGVLRGDNARFQLFGDTINTASRMESTGKPNKIHVSKVTADLLIEAGKGHWLERRLDTVVAKGKGELETYWLANRRKGSDTASTVSESPQRTSEEKPSIEFKDRRIVEWNVAVLEARLKVIVSHRRKADPCDVDLGRTVVQELESFVQGIAYMYKADNPFHNFLHASHVTMAVTKMLSRIVAAEDGTSSSYAKGIADDPMTHFAVVFGALVHDVDHTGVPNSRLVEEGSPLANLYQNKSVAENNSIDVALKFLMQPEFTSLRGCLCPTPSEWRRFETLIRSIVLATDIMDKDLKADRNARWAKVFGKQEAGSSPDETDRLKATIVLEHLIQASDIAHTMQHWHIYVKWNERLFEEMYKAYREGRADKDPSEGWYQGEIGFFDFYIIPLARKLEECGVFGVSSDEFLSYATNNRNEWEVKGREVVAGYVEKYCKPKSESVASAALGEGKVGTERMFL